MFENNKILILGFARSGYEAAKLLINRQNQVFLTDRSADQDLEKIDELKELGVKLVLGEHPIDLLDNSFDYLIKNPGVPIDHEYVIRAKELGIEVINEVEMAYRLLPKDIKLVGITGTNGKTTTTTLVYEMLKRDGRRAHLTGNIGYPLCSFLDKLEANDIIVMEVSAQQLENLNKFNPDIAVLTNLSEAHLEFFPGYDYYKSLKLKIFKNHTSNNIAILNMEDEKTIALTKDIKSTVKYFSSNKEINGSYIKDDSIYYYNEKIINVEDIKLVGKHNYENIMAAIMVVKEFDVNNSTIVDLLKEFGGVEHRIEFVREVNERKFFNDSKATNIVSTQIALSSFKTPTIILLGGLERNQDFTELKEYMKNVKAIVCYGECKNRIKVFGDSLMIETIVVDTLKEATKRAYELSNTGDTVLLSPAAASWDQYKCFEDRGNEFKDTVKSLD